MKYNRNRLNKLRNEAYKYGFVKDSHALANLLIKYPTMTEIVDSKDSDKIRSGSEYAGHGAFGESEFTYYDYVIVEKEKITIYKKDMLIMENDKILKVVSDYNLEINFEELTEKLKNEYEKTIS